MKLQDIIIKHKFILPGDNLWNFYAGVDKDNSYDGYISRKSSNILNSDSNAGYISERYGALEEQGCSSKIHCTSKDWLKTAAKPKNNTIFHDIIVSFDKNYAEKNNISSWRSCSKPVIEALKMAFTSNGFSWDNIEWHAAAHTNTDNFHIHIKAYEKHKSIDRGKFKISTKNKMLATIMANTELFNDKIMYSSINRTRKLLKELATTIDCPTNKMLINNLYKIKKIASHGRLQYGHIKNESLMNLVDYSAELLISSSRSLKLAYSELKFNTEELLVHTGNEKLYKDTIKENKAIVGNLVLNIAKELPNKKESPLALLKTIPKKVFSNSQLVWEFKKLTQEIIRKTKYEAEKAL